MPVPTTEDIYPRIKRINFTDSKNWLLVKLDKGINWQEKHLEYILIRSSDDIPLQRGIKQKYSYLKAVSDINILENKKGSSDEHGFIDWVLVEI
ncbi:MAG TPA: hypothetical protein ENJ95_10215 [Bacteroidetes bacterium]|nr:hypothetical protein [Bacteroidota bacterium]